jgi:hypothetical protein
MNAPEHYEEQDEAFGVVEHPPDVLACYDEYTGMQNSIQPLHVQDGCGLRCDLPVSVDIRMQEHLPRTTSGQFLTSILRMPRAFSSCALRHARKPPLSSNVTHPTVPCQTHSGIIDSSSHGNEPAHHPPHHTAVPCTRRLKEAQAEKEGVQSANWELLQQLKAREKEVAALQERTKSLHAEVKQMHEDNMARLDNASANANGVSPVRRPAPPLLPHIVAVLD